MFKIFAGVLVSALVISIIVAISVRILDLIITW
jgi:hypothetical protein